MKPRESLAVACSGSLTTARSSERRSLAAKLIGGTAVTGETNSAMTSLSVARRISSREGRILRLYLSVPRRKHLRRLFTCCINRPPVERKREARACERRARPTPEALLLLEIGPLLLLCVVLSPLVCVLLSPLVTLGGTRPQESSFKWFRSSPFHCLIRTFRGSPPPVLAKTPLIAPFCNEVCWTPLYPFLPLASTEEGWAGRTIRPAPRQDRHLLHWRAAARRFHLAAGGSRA